MTTPPSPHPYKRHALGLPAGSIRALIAFSVLGALWLIAWKHADNAKAEVTFVYLQYVMILILAHFFASHGNTIGKHISPRSPLGLPSGSVRFLLLAGYLGLVAWLYYNQGQFTELPSVSLMLPVLLLGAFLLGFLVTKVIRTVTPGGQEPYWFQDVGAWLALLSMIGLLIIVMVRVFINPGVTEDLRLELGWLEKGVAVVVGFYFGART